MKTALSAVLAAVGNQDESCKATSTYGELGVTT